MRAACCTVLSKLRGLRSHLGQPGSSRALSDCSAVEGNVDQCSDREASHLAVSRSWTCSGKGRCSLRMGSVPPGQEPVVDMLRGEALLSQFRKPLTWR